MKISDETTQNSSINVYILNIIYRSECLQSCRSHKEELTNQLDRPKTKICGIEKAPLVFLIFFLLCSEEPRIRSFQIYAKFANSMIS